MLQRAIDRSSGRLVYIAPVFMQPGQALETVFPDERIVNDNSSLRVVFRTFDSETAGTLGWRDGEDLIFVVETPKSSPVC